MYTYEYSEDIQLEVIYDFDPGQEMQYPDTPPIAPSVELNKIYLAGDRFKQDITEILADWLIEAIEIEITDSLTDY